MKKINLTIGALLLGSVLFASNFVACGGSDSSGTPGVAGTTGSSGTTGQAGTGTTDGGGAGTGAGPVDASSAMLADGRCAPGSFRRDGVCLSWSARSGRAHRRRRAVVRLVRLCHGCGAL